MRFDQDLEGMVWNEELDGYKPFMADQASTSAPFSNEYLDWLAANVEYVTMNSYYRALDAANMRTVNGGFILSSAELAIGRDRLPRKPLLSNAFQEGICTSTYEVCGYDKQASHFERWDAFILVLHGVLQNRMNPAFIQQKLDRHKKVKLEPDFVEYLVQARKNPGSKGMFPIYTPRVQEIAPTREFGVILRYDDTPVNKLNNLTNARAGTDQVVAGDMLKEEIANAGWGGYKDACSWKKRGIIARTLFNISTLEEGEVKQVVYYHDHFRNREFGGGKTTFAIIPGKGKQPIRMGGGRRKR